MSRQRFLDRRIRKHRRMNRSPAWWRKQVGYPGAPRIQSWTCSRWYRTDPVYLYSKIRVVCTVITSSLLYFANKYCLLLTTTISSWHVLSVSNNYYLLLNYYVLFLLTNTISCYLNKCYLLLTRTTFC